MEAIRKISGTITLLEVVSVNRLRGGRLCAEKIARLQCSCGFKYRMALVRWRLNPPYACQKCTIKRRKAEGFHGFRARR